MKRKNLVILLYKLDNKKLLYLINYNRKKYLYILNNLIANIFKITYNNIKYYKFNKVFKKLYNLIINRARRQLYIYIKKYS